MLRGFGASSTLAAAFLARLLAGGDPSVGLDRSDAGAGGTSRALAGAAAAAGGAEALLTSARGSDLPSDMPIAVAAAREAI